MIFKGNKYKYDFQQYETIRYFGERIYTGKIKIDEAKINQRNLLKNLVEFNNKSIPRTIEGKDKKEILMKVHMLFMKWKINSYCFQKWNISNKSNKN